MTDPAVQPHVSSRFSSTRSRDTAPEMAIRRILHRRGLRYRVNYSAIPGNRRSVDIAFPRERLAIYVDGCFWHRCPLHFVEPGTRTEFWRQKINGNVERDEATNQLMSNHGWVVMRFWEHHDPTDVADDIFTFVRGCN